MITTLLIADIWCQIIFNVCHHGFPGRNSMDNDVLVRTVLLKKTYIISHILWTGYTACGGLLRTYFKTIYLHFNVTQVSLLQVYDQSSARQEPYRTWIIASYQSTDDWQHKDIKTKHNKAMCMFYGTNDMDVADRCNSWYGINSRNIIPTRVQLLPNLLIFSYSAYWHDRVIISRATLLTTSQDIKMACLLWPLLPTWFNFNPCMDK